MNITYDPAKRALMLKTRGLDFEDAKYLFANDYYTFEDTRTDYSEKRMIAYGILKQRLVVVVYVQREETMRIISMRKANSREQKRVAFPRA